MELTAIALGCRAVAAPRACLLRADRSADRRPRSPADQRRRRRPALERSAKLVARALSSIVEPLLVRPTRSSFILRHGRSSCSASVGGPQASRRTSPSDRASQDPAPRTWRWSPVSSRSVTRLYFPGSRTGAPAVPPAELFGRLAHAVSRGTSSGCCGRRHARGKPRRRPPSKPHDRVERAPSSVASANRPGASAIHRCIWSLLLSRCRSGTTVAWS